MRGIGSVVEIGNSAFKDCKALDSMEFPDSVVKIGDSAFLGCGKLTAIELPDSEVRLGQDAFTNCYGLKYLKLSSKKTGAGQYAFSRCSSLATIEIPEGAEYSFWNDSFSHCDAIETIIAADDSVVEDFARNTGLERFLEKWQGTEE